MIIRNRIRRKGLYGRLFVLMLAMSVIGIACAACRKREAISPLPEGLRSALLYEETIIDYVQEDSTVYAVISSVGNEEYGDYFMIFTEEAEGWYRSYENDFADIKPWKIELADVDGDAVKEIIIAVKKATRYDKEEKNRMFVFNYQEGMLIRKWTGSQIAGYWRDFYSADMVSAPGDELIFIEETEDEKERILVYSWFDFGFVKLAESEKYTSIKELSLPGGNIIEIITDDGQQRSLVMKDGKLKTRK